VVVSLRSQVSLEEMLESVLKVPYEQFTLIGFSMGGYVAQEFALRFPQRVKRLILLGSSCEGYPPQEKEVVLKALPMIEKGLFKGLTEKRMKEFLHPDSYRNDHIRQLIQSMAGADASEVYLRQLRATLNRRDLSRTVREISCPFHVIAGKEDRIVPLESILRFELFAPKVDVHLLSECGHFLPLEKPERVNELLFQFETSATSIVTGNVPAAQPVAAGLI
jgi:pimeloyl-ACP methyl ester carboxylesterase